MVVAKCLGVSVAAKVPASVSLRVAPITVRAARAKVAKWHRHLPELQGGLFACQLVDAEGECVGVAVAGNPARAWQGTGRLVVSRVATDGTKQACSMLYGAICRAARALGYLEVWTYTLPEEPGTSLRASGFEFVGMTRGGTHDTPARRRNAPVRGEPKKRWVRYFA